MKLKKLTVADIRELGPCYDPTEKVAEDWVGTVLDILKMESVSPQDRIWVVSHYLTDRRNRLFAVWCAREALKRIKNPDQRSVDACDIAERFASGDATESELAAAWDAARDAAWGAAWDAARDAARDAAWEAAWDAAWEAAWDAQIKKLIEMIEADLDDGDASG